MWLVLRNYRADLDTETSFALVTAAWLAASVIGAIPLYVFVPGSSLVDAWFESVSGFTGTGATVIADVEALDKAVLLWRSLTQWLGGMGIIVLFLALFPALGLGSVQLFKAEVAGPQKDRVTPRVRETARKLWILYCVFTAALAFFLIQAGLSSFDAINHAFTTLATGGFSTRNAGFAAFANPVADTITAIFMLLAAVNFSLHYRFFVQREARALLDTELKWYAALVALFTCAIALLIYERHTATLDVAFGQAFFVVSSVASSTGFSRFDFAIWPVSVQLLLVLLRGMGGMSGSTAGGVKCIRLVAALKLLGRHLRQMVHPNAIITVKANDQTIPESVIDAIWSLLFVYFVTFSIASVVLTLTGVDLVTSTTAVFSSLSNIGPALGQLGPSATYAALNPTAKFTLSACMLLGRLEFFTVLVLFTREYWRK